MTINKLLETVGSMSEDQKNEAREKLAAIEAIQFDLEFDDPKLEDMYKLRTLVSHF